MNAIRPHLPRRSPVARSAACRGFTVTELLIAITSISVLSVLAMTVAGLLMTAEHHSAEELWIDSTIAALAADLRTDAHSTRQVAIGPADAANKSTCTFSQSDDSRISYECADGSVVRRVLEQGTIASAETYRLPFGQSWFELANDGRILTWQHVRAVSTIGGYATPEQGETVPERRYYILAAIGIRNDPSAPIEGESQ